MVRSKRAGSAGRWPKSAALLSCAAAIALLLGLVKANHDSNLVFGTNADPAATAPTAAGRTASRLFIDPALLVKLQTLADGLNKEIVLCLTGTVTEGVGRATDFVMPTVHTSTPTSSSVEECPAGTIGVWHNHTLVGTALARMARSWTGIGQPRTPGVAAELCRLSARDIETLAGAAYAFSVISVDRDTWCWWSRDQVEEFVATGESSGHPIEGQIHARR